MDDFAARLRRLPSDTLTALAFFSRLPVPRAPAELDLKTSAAGWPVAGFVLALAPALVLLVALAVGLPAPVAAAMALALLAALTGAMHEDGLADTVDGFGGGATPQAKLAIMRDSRIGTYGVLALIFAIAIKLAALSAMGARPGHAALALACTAVVARALAIWHWSATPPARSDGMAHAAGRPDRPALHVGFAAGAVAALLLLIGFRGAAIIAILLAAAAVGLFSQLARRQIHGHTGDTIGAAEQIAETLLLAGLSIAGPSIAA